MNLSQNINRKSNERFDIVELARRFENLLRLGTVAEFDAVAAKVKVEYAKDENQEPVLTDWIKWGVESASENIVWNPPAIGELVLMGSQSGNMALAVIICRFYQTTHQAPESSATLHQFNKADGAIFSYDTSTSELTFTLPENGKINFVAPGGFTFTGNFDLDGNFTATGNIHSDKDVSDSIGTLKRLRINFNTSQYIGNLGGLTSTTNKPDQ